MKYIVVKKDDIDLSNFYQELTKIIIEVLPNGVINREIGFDFKDRIIHKYPSANYRYGKYGVFDSNIISIDNEDKDNISKSKFESYWMQK